MIAEIRNFQENFSYLGIPGIFFLILIHDRIELKKLYQNHQKKNFLDFLKQKEPSISLITDY